MVAFSEMMLVLLLVASPNSLGLPLGVPPADEVPLLAQVAPDDCLFYASWATADGLDATRSATEQWLAQPKIQAFWKTVRTNYLASEPDDPSFDSTAEYALSDLAAALAEQALIRATAVFVENGDRWEHLQGGCVIHLAPETVEPLAAKLATIVEAVPGNWSPRSFAVGGNQYTAFKPLGGDTELAVGIRGEFAVIGAGPDASESIERIDKRVGGTEPAWLTQMKNDLPVPRRSSMSRFDVLGLLRLAETEPSWSAFQSIVLDLLKLDAVRSIESVCGVDQRGMISRQLVRLDPAVRGGLPGIFHLKPLPAGCWEVLEQKRDWTGGIRFSVDELFDLIGQLSAFDGGPSFEENLEEFRQEYGVRLKEDLLDYFDGSVLIQGNFDSANPLGELLIQVGLDDEMSFFDNYETFNERMRELIASTGDGSRFVVDEWDGTNVYSIDHPRDFMFFPEPVWCLRGGFLCIAFDKSAIQKRIESPGPRLAADEDLKALLEETAQLGLDKPLGVTRIDMASAIRLLMSFSSMFGPMLEDGPIQVADFPTADVLTHGLAPSVAYSFRTEKGLEVFARQTLPSAAPGATLAGLGLMTAPSAMAIRTSGQMVMSRNNLQQIAIALHNYHDAHMALPARFNQDIDEKPLLSWRVHILPFLEEIELYEQFHLDEPWDSEHNRTLIEQMPEYLVHPKLKLPPGITVYLALAGKDTVWREPKDAKQQPTGVTLEEISVRDGTSRTAFLIEVPAESAVIWTKPDDFDVDQAGFAEKLKKVWSNGLIVTMVDASVHTFRDDLSAEQWRALFNYKDGIAQELESMRSR